MARRGRSYKRVLLVSGTQRSGTSAMSKLLSSHSDMIVTNERYIRLGTDENHQKIDYQAFEKERLLFPQPHETQNYHWGNNGPAHQALLEKYDTAQVVGDKVPLYHYYIDHLFGVMGKARLIFMIRNVVDVADSWQARFDDPDDLVWEADYRSSVSMWNRDNRVILEAMKRYPQRIRVVSYERLYSYSPAYLGKVLSFAGVSGRDPAILTGYREMTDGWMGRFSKPSRLSPAQRDWVLKVADQRLYNEVIDAGEV